VTGDLDGRVLTFLQRWADDLPTAAEIAASIREDGRAVGAALRRLEKAGKVRRAGGTGYRGSPAWTVPGHIPNPNYGAQPVPIDDHTTRREAWHA
jgi:hypothetical protein